MLIMERQYPEIPGADNLPAGNNIGVLIIYICYTHFLHTQAIWNNVYLVLFFIQ